MTKAKAKSLLSDLIDRGLTPNIKSVGANYIVGVIIPGGTTTTIVGQVETTLAITARVYSVEFE